MTGGTGTSGRGRRGVPVPPPGFRSPSWVVRAACLTGLVAASGAVLTVAADAVGLPKGYNKAQTAGAAALAAPQDWAVLRRGTARDIGLYVPLYLAYGLAVMGIVSPAPRRPEAAPHWWSRLPRTSPALTAAMVGIALADVGETVLFRASLTRLLAGGGEPQIRSLVRAREGGTAAKLGFAALVLLMLAVRVLRRPPAQDGSHLAG